MIKTYLLIIILLVSMSGATLLQRHIDSGTDYSAMKTVFVTLPPGKTLKILSFGYDSLLSDMLYLWAVQFYSTTYLENRFDFIEQVFQTITDLAPHYKDPYTVGALIMAMEKKDPAMAIRLLEKGASNNPGDWFFYQDAGYYAHKYLKDYKKAAELYAKAAQNPDAPEVIRRLQAHWTYMKDDLDTAWEIWMELYTNSRSEMERNSAYNHLYQIKTERDRKELNQVIRRFHEQTGRSPRNLEELVRNGLIPQVPRDFSDQPYNYDPDTGVIKAKREYRWKKH